ncbi:hypothetical protein, partial [Aurantimonas coralicida]|uniref:hypothetical protein n=1 Tax=Aurantimonas coralicida TaxID=182270 RepID=UPI00238DC339
MRRRWIELATIGAASAAGSLTVIALLYGILAGQNYVCNADESTISCTRNWLNLLAIAVGAGTIVFLAKGQRLETDRQIRDTEWREEMAVLQFLEMRVKVNAAHDLARRILRNVDAIEKSITLM